MNLQYLVKYLWKRKWLVLIPTLMAVGLSWWFSRNRAAEYTSMAELSTGYMDVNPYNLDSRAPNNTVLFNNVIQTLGSNRVLDLVSYDLLLHDLQGKNPYNDVDVSQLISRYPGQKKGLITALSNKRDSLHVLNLSNERDRVISLLAEQKGYSPKALTAKVQISRIEGSDFIRVLSSTTNPELSAFIANAICQKFLTLYKSSLGQASAMSLDTLRNMMNAKKQLLDSKLSLFDGDEDASFSSSMGLLNSLQGQLLTQRNNLVAATVELDHINAQIGTEKEQGGTPDNEHIIILRQNIDKLYAQYVNGGSSDQNLLQKIGQLRESLQQQLSAAGTGGGNIPMGDLIKQKMDTEVKISVAKQTINDLQKQVQVLKGDVQSSSVRQKVEQGLQNEIELARKQYEDANKLYNDALNRDRFPGNNFKQVLQASPSLYPVSDSSIKVIGLAGAGIFFLAVFLLLFFDFVDPSVKTPGRLQASLPYPLLANLEQIGRKGPSVESLFDTGHKISRREKKYKEQIKQLRYEVKRSGKKIFLVAGSRSGSGKTAFLECLAAGLSLSDDKILLVDANFRNNTLTRKYNAESTVESYKPTGNKDTDDKALTQMAVAGSDQHIQVIGCGTGDYTPAEILPGKNLFSVLQQQQVYDFVLIDCASLNQGPDGKELLEYVDGVILLFAANQPFTEEDKSLVSFFEEQKSVVLGAVLNRIPSYAVES